MSNVQQAQDYARNHGLYVFPTKPDKSPATRHGFKDATDRPEELIQLFGKGVHGLGVWPGPSGYVVVDIDVKDGAAGDEEWHDLVEEHGLIINTPTVLTPSGGTHLWFRKPEGVVFDNTKLSPSIDIRSDAGYVVAPPTEGYEWEVSYPEVCKVCSVQHHQLEKAQMFPAALVRVLEKSRVWSPEVQATGPIPAGSRYDTLFRAGSKMKYAGLTDDLLRKALQDMNAERCKPPHSKQHVDKIVQAIIDNPPMNPETGATGIEPAYTRIRHTEGTVKWPELWEKKADKVEWIPHMVGIAINGRATNLYGPAGTGKSELVLNRAAKAAREGVRVLWLDREMTDIDVRDRLREMSFTPEDLKNLDYILYPDLPLLDTPRGGEALVALAKTHRSDVVVVDSLSKFVRDEEGETHTNYYLHTILPLRVEGIGYVMIDHAGKDLTRKARGASQKVDNVDYYTEITRQAGVGASLSTKKQRHSWVEPRYTYRRFTQPHLDYKLSEPMCSFCHQRRATRKGGPAMRPACDTCMPG